MIKLTRLLTIIALLCAFTLFAQEQAVKSNEFLPANAISRLGRGMIYNMDYSPDNSQLAIGTTMGIWIYDASNLQPVRLITKHEYMITAVEFSEDGNMLATADILGHVQLWDTKTGQHQLEIDVKKQLYCISFNTAGDTIATGDKEGRIRLYNTQTGALKMTLYRRGPLFSNILRLDFRPDGLLLASARKDKTVTLWHTESGREIHTMTTGDDAVRGDLVFSPDGNTLVCSTWKGDVYFWNPVTGEQKQQLNKKEMLAPISIDFSFDGGLIAFGASGAKIHLWNMNTSEIWKTLTGHRAPVLAAFFDANIRTIVSTSRRNILRHDINSGRQIRRINEHRGLYPSCAVSPDGKTIATLNTDSYIHYWDATTGAFKSEVRIRNLYVFVEDMMYSSDGKTLIITDGRGPIYLFNAETAKLERRIIAHIADVLCIDQTSDSKILVSGGKDKTVRIWNADTGKALFKLNGHTDEVSCVAVSPDNKIAASGSSDQTVIIWDINTGDEIDALAKHSDEVSSVTFSPDGKTLVTTDGSDTIYLWEVQTGEKIRTLTGNSSGVVSVVFSADGKSIATGSEDGTVNVYDYGTGGTQHTLNGHNRGVDIVDFASDGNVLVSRSYDGVIFLWNVDGK